MLHRLHLYSAPAVRAYKFNVDHTRASAVVTKQPFAVPSLMVSRTLYDYELRVELNQAPPPGRREEGTTSGAE